MTSLAAPPPPSLQRRIVRKAVRVCKRELSFPLRHWHQHVLRSDYLRGSSSAARAVPIEEPDPAIIETGRVLRQQLLDASRRKHASMGYRVLMLRPRSLTAEIWFGDLERSMQHAGIDCRVLPHDTPTAKINAAFEAFQPNVLIATEGEEALTSLDLRFVHSYKRQHGCLRQFIPVWHSNGPREQVPSGRSTLQQDEWRRNLRRGGLLADAYFSIFEPEFHERFSLDPTAPAIDYVAIPMACNPFADYPVAAPKRHDYFMATSMVDERLQVSYQFLRPILSRYRGLWAGPGWGFGAGSIAPADLPLHYAQTRIALSPLAGFVHLYGAEVTHRVYATAACGAFQLTMPTPITHRYFKPDELVQAATTAEYARLFDHYVDRPLERNAIALAALRRVYAEHTCLHRVDKFVSHWNDWRRRGLF
jgi:hypothetical protein